MSDLQTIVFGKQSITIEDVNALALRQANVKLNDTPDYIDSIEKSVAFLERLLKRMAISTASLQDMVTVVALKFLHI
ncbi:hypothetical protein [Vibrio taketomensis]|uniref:hypothetical protein n=1 Tax=Vibrio taketomensis TaxID=2572923 RepID=UPI001E5912B3|nr:hypothetical protein [Vibrio taketomensis]